jgi:hypothetical protein
VETQLEIEQATPAEEDALEREPAKQIRTDPDLLNRKRQQVVDAFSRLKGKELVRKSKTLFWSADHALRVCCAVSKRYAGDYQPYWYAYHPKWDEFLAEGSWEAYFILASMDRNEAYAVPYSWFQKNKQNLNQTDRGDKSYWHIALTTIEGGNLAINLSRLGTKISLAPFGFASFGDQHTNSH